MMKSSAFGELQGDVGDASSVVTNPNSSNNNSNTSNNVSNNNNNNQNHQQLWMPPPNNDNHSNDQQQQQQQLNLFKLMLGNCYCGPTASSGLFEKLNPTIQFVELHGINFIGLGCMSDELTPRERVYDTLEQLTDRRERLVSIGYVTSPSSSSSSSASTQTIPLDVWTKTYPQEAHSMARPVQNLIQQVKTKDYTAAKLQLQLQLTAQKKNAQMGNNRYLAGITAHNLAVTMILSGHHPHDGVLDLFQEAIHLKEQAFGPHGLEVAYSWDELGVQYFCAAEFEPALHAFGQAQKVRRAHLSSTTTLSTTSSTATLKAGLAMVLNNIACCNFQLRHFKSALLTLQEARVLQQESMGQQTQCADLDLLYHAIVISNLGYLHLCLKLYEEARSLFEEALLIQQSVLDDTHRAIRDTRSNLEFTNAFHL